MFIDRLRCERCGPTCDNDEKTGATFGVKKMIFRGSQERVGGMSAYAVGGWYFNDSCAPMLLNVWREHIFEKFGIAPAVRKGEYKGVGPFCFGHVHGSRQKAVS